MLKHLSSNHNGQEQNSVMFVLYNPEIRNGQTNQKNIINSLMEYHSFSILKTADSG